MDKKRLPFKNQEEIIRCMEREIQQQKEVIRTQNEQIRSLKNQIKPNPNPSSFSFPSYNRPIPQIYRVWDYSFLVV